jgi:hypothetical protein
LLLLGWLLRRTWARNAAVCACVQAINTFRREQGHGNRCRLI